MQLYPPLLLSGVLALASGSSRPLANTQNGPYAGAEHASLPVNVFRSIRYAAAPVGARRFSPPQPYEERWRVPRDASQFGPHCHGYGGVASDHRMAEDCLTLNAYVPTNATASAPRGKGLPVVIWIHGGDMINGGAALPMYDLSRFAATQGVVAVSIQYRLAGWGMLVSREMVRAGATNLALQDQRAAFAWVRRNAAAFGGDGGRVTIWGESAGALSVGSHLLGKPDGLFHRAIAQSGGPIFYDAHRELPYYERAYADLLKSVNCTSLSCLRSVPENALDAAFSERAWTWTIPYIAPPIFPREGVLPSELLLRGDFTRVPLIIGTTTDESTLWAPTDLNSTQDFRDYMQHRGDPQASISAASLDRFERLYPDSPSTQLPRSYALEPALVGRMYKRAVTWLVDKNFLSGTRAAARAWTERAADVWVYRFDQLARNIPPHLGVAHASDLWWVMLNFEGRGWPFGDGAPYDEKGRALAWEMAGRWGAFIRGESPDVKGGAKWEVYGRERPGREMVFGGQGGRLGRDGERREGTDFMNSLSGTELNR